MSKAALPRPDAYRQQIVGSLTPVRPLAGPGRRLWMLAVPALLLAVAASIVTGMRGDLRAYAPLLTWGMTLVQAVLGMWLLALGLRESVPGRNVSRSALALAAALTVLVVAVVTLTTNAASPSISPAGRVFRDWVECVIWPTALGAPFMLLATLMAVRAFPTRPAIAGGLCGLSAGVLSDAGWRLSCGISDPSHVIESHALAILGLTIAGAALAVLADAPRWRPSQFGFLFRFGFRFRIGHGAGRLWMLLFVFGLSSALLMPRAGSAQTTIHALTEVIEGHQVGGVAIDLVGNLYVADFGDIVWKITPEGDRRELAAGLYGASGNAIDKAGNLLQASFYGDSIVKIDRTGHVAPFVATGLDGPVGIAIDRRTGDVYVANCRGNSISKIAAANERPASTFATSPLFRCPNGLAFDGGGNLYVTNFRNNALLKIEPHGVVSAFATIDAKGHGLGHVCFKDDRLYVTAYASHALYEVTLDGTATRILGNGERGIVDGSATDARLSFPNGIACDPWTRRLYINEYVSESTASLPRRAIVREVDLGSIKRPAP